MMTVEPAAQSEPDLPIAAAAPEPRRSIRWWEPVLVPVVAAVAWLVLLFALALVGGFLGGLMGYGWEIGRFAAMAQPNFLVLQIAMASFYLALVLTMRLFAKRRDPAPFLRYFPAIGTASVLRAVLSGLILAGVVVLVIAGLAWTGLVNYHPSAGDLALREQSLAQLLISAFVLVLLAPLAEESYFRGLLLEWLQQKLAPLYAALVTAIIFALVHGRFLIHPGILGWTETAAIAALGLLNAWWVERTRSLRAPVAAHATYNATILLFVFFAR